MATSILIGSLKFCVEDGCCKYSLIIQMQRHSGLVRSERWEIEYGMCYFYILDFV